jgi:hypothetical protein
VRRDLGDFQTPPELAAAVLECLGPIGQRWPRVLEPTCGQGSFIAGLLTQRSPPREIQGVEIQDGHCALAREISQGDANPHGVRVRIHQGDFFRLDLNRDIVWQDGGPLLVVGNPPWVTSAELGRIPGSFRPPKRRIDGLNGLAALTGASNFDVAEAVWLKLISELAGQATTIALLCKTSVARRILQRAHRARLPIATASIHRLDAAHWFGAAVDACLFQVALGDSQKLCRVPVYENLAQTHAESMMGFARGWLIADDVAYASSSFADGACPFIWRQGVKHDVASVMELIHDPLTGVVKNRAGQILDVEARFVYPLIKGSDLARDLGTSPNRAVLVTQQRIGENTVPLAMFAPRFWSYLQANSAAFAKRRSSIYRGAPPFAMFGIGPYSFSPFKVATGGLHKEPRFRALGPRGGKPVMLDDTCYFLPCHNAPEAALLTALCNDPISLAFLRAARFKTAKRPITKAILQRVDLPAILARTDRRALLTRAKEVQKRELEDFPGESLSDAIEIYERDFAGLMSYPGKNGSSNADGSARD